MQGPDDMSKGRRRAIHNLYRNSVDIICVSTSLDGAYPSIQDE